MNYLTKSATWLLIAAGPAHKSPLSRDGAQDKEGMLPTSPHGPDLPINNLTSRNRLNGSSATCAPHHLQGNYMFWPPFQKLMEGGMKRRLPLMNSYQTLSKVRQQGDGQPVHSCTTASKWCQGDPPCWRALAQDSLGLRQPGIWEYGGSLNLVTTMTLCVSGDAA